MTNFSDIFKSSFLNNVTSVSIPDMLLTLFLSMALGMFIFFVYKRSFSGVLYSPSFGVTLVALCMVTATTILAVTSNVVLSLGMVGALSIVRFRTAIKEPTDLVFLFWSISGGIVLAAGMLPLAIIASIVIGLVLIILSKQKSHSMPYILAINCQDENVENQALEIIKKNCEKYVLKSKTVRNGSITLDYEVRLKNEATAFVNTLDATEGISNAALVSFNGEYLG